jgi:hypothetical protein
MEESNMTLSNEKNVPKEASNAQPPSTNTSQTPATQSWGDSESWEKPPMDISPPASQNSHQFPSAQVNKRKFAALHPSSPPQTSNKVIIEGTPIDHHVFPLSALIDALNPFLAKHSSNQLTPNTITFQNTKPTYFNPGWVISCSSESLAALIVDTINNPKLPPPINQSKAA